MFNDSRQVVDAWEGIVRAKTTVSDTAWFVEIAIPFRTLRFTKSAQPQDGRQLHSPCAVHPTRRPTRSPLDRQYRVHRMSKAGTLAGLEGLTPGRNLTIKPYALAGHSTGSQVPSTSLGGRYDAGLDLKYGVTSRLAARSDDAHGLLAGGGRPGAGEPHSFLAVLSRMMRFLH